jgi:exodeoxyribonuclease III
MRIITLNANGIRAAAGKGFFAWMHRQDADIVCIQETKAQHAQLGDRHFFPPGYHAWYHDAVSKGYSGVAIYSRLQPDRVHYGLGWEVMDREGRCRRAPRRKSARRSSSSAWIFCSPAWRSWRATAAIT